MLDRLEEDKPLLRLVAGEDRQVTQRRDGRGAILGVRQPPAVDDAGLPGPGKGPRCLSDLRLGHAGDLRYVRELDALERLRQRLVLRDGATFARGRGGEGARGRGGDGDGVGSPRLPVTPSPQ